MVEDVQDIQYSTIPALETAEKLFTVTTKTGRVFRSRAVVLAIGPGDTKVLPWKLSEGERAGACHNLDIQGFPSPGVKQTIRKRQETNIVVVGGGLSSAQLADMAIRKGVTKVWYLLRGDLKGAYSSARFVRRQ
jgi:thioredoxin reductase